MCPHNSIGLPDSVRAAASRPILLKNSVLDAIEKLLAPQTNQNFFDMRGQ